VAIDQDGHERQGWLSLPNGHVAMPRAFGADGTIYATDSVPESNGLIYAFDSQGALKPGWPQLLSPTDDWLGPLWSPYIVPGPNGTLYGTREGELTILGPDGKTLATSRLGAQAEYLTMWNAAARSDGYLFTLGLAPLTDDYHGPDAVVVVFDPQARIVAQDGHWLWDQNCIAMGADGTVVAWAEKQDPNKDHAGESITLAVIGTDGKPTAGWPKTIKGESSYPVVGADGTVYLTVDPTSSSAARILAFLPNGEAKPGWPYDLPSGDVGSPAFNGMDGPMYPASPVVATNGVVYQVVQKQLRDDSGLKIAAGDTVLGLSSNGEPLPGWPARLQGKVSLMGLWIGGIPMEYPVYMDPLWNATASGSAILYVHTDAGVVAIFEDGRSVIESSSGMFGSWALMPDGGLMTVDVGVRLTRWLPDGTPAH
jgi:hypothetical protein